MNKFRKFNLCNSLEVSIKLSHLIPIQRMSIVNFTNDNPCNVKEEHLISNEAKSEARSSIVITQPQHRPQIESLQNSGLNNNQCFTNPQLYNPYPYSDFYNSQFYFCNPTNQPYYNRSYPLYLHNYYLNPVNQHIPVHLGGARFQNNSVRRKSFGKRIMSLRNWEKIDNPGHNPGFIFTLMSYNVLAQDLLEQHPYLYKYHDNESLNWPIRWENLVKELSRFKPDVLCLQEVQESHLERYYSFLITLGYLNVFKKRTGDQTDGCAIYYKADTISVIEYKVVEFFQRHQVPLLNRDNVGIIMKLVPKMHPTREFIVATTHLLYNPKAEHVRIAQMQLLLTDIEKMSYQKKGEVASYLPIILTGDFNSPPYSSLYEFVAKGSINYENLPPKLLGSCEDSDEQTLVTSFLGITDSCQHEHIVALRNSKDENIPIENSCTNNDKKLSHNFNFKSVYTHGSTEATTHQNEWLTVDYIFFSTKKEEMNTKEKLKLLSRYKLPLGEDLKGITIPNKILGSDHFSLIAKFKLEF